MNGDSWYLVNQNIWINKKQISIPWLLESKGHWTNLTLLGCLWRRQDSRVISIDGQESWYCLHIDNKSKSFISVWIECTLVFLVWIHKITSKLNTTKASIRRLNISSNQKQCLKSKPILVSFPIPGFL
jgi:hypothetical protein